MKPSLKNGGLIWITGLSGSGKTTIAKELVKYYQNKAILIDGDEVRKVLDLSSSGYDYKGRKQIAFMYARLCNLLSNQGFLVICATISMYDEVRQWNKDNNKYYCEIFLDIDEAERKKRDPKKLYANHKNNLINNMAGLDYEIELPKEPDIIINETVSIDESIDMIVDYLNKD